MRWLTLVCVLLAACATPASGVREDREDDESLDAVSSWDEARADPSCVVPLCDEEHCALWRCRDLVEIEEVPSPSPSVVLALDTTVGLRPPLVGNPNRWWGHPLAVPTYAEPIFEIPWHNWKLRDQLARQKHPLGCMLPPEPLEKHHIFPQQLTLAKWFELKRIDIHAFTILLPRSIHRGLHSGAPAGGQWNEAWRQFRKNNENATTEEIWRFAFEHMFLFRVNGPFTPYYCQD
jgi:uncharacterized lipoprotein (TIGR02269 family)